MKIVRTNEAENVVSFSLSYFWGMFNKIVEGQKLLMA